MSISIINTDSQALAPTYFVDAITTDLDNSRSVVVLTPNFTYSLGVQRVLAQKGLGLGVDFATPMSFIDGSWKLYGDTRQIIDNNQRYLIVRSIVNNKALTSNTIEFNPGTVSLCSNLAKETLCYLDDDYHTQDVFHRGDNHIYSEHELLDILNDYKNELLTNGLVEPCQASSVLVNNFKEDNYKLDKIYALGFSDMKPYEVDFICKLSCLYEVEVFIQNTSTEASELTEDLVDMYKSFASRYSLDINTTKTKESCAVDRNPEIDSLLNSLFDSVADSVEPTGAVTCLLPAGPVSEAELVVRSCESSLDKGNKSIALVSRDCKTTYTQTVNKLIARDISVEAQVRVRVLDTYLAKTVLEFLKQFAYILDLDWPSARDTKFGKIDMIGDMDWWPPRSIIDFMLSDFSGMATEDAWALDTSFRGNRLLNPDEVIKTLRKASKTSETVSQMTNDLMLGKLTSALVRVKKHIVENKDKFSDIDYLESVGAIDALINSGMALSRAHIACDRAKSNNEIRISLLEMVSLLEEMQLHKSIAYNPSMRLDNSKGTVSIVSPNYFSSVEPASFDVVYVLGQETLRSPIAAADDALSNYIACMSNTKLKNPLHKERFVFYKLLSAAKCGVVLERLKCDNNSKETFPSVMFSEALSCYGYATGSKDEFPLEIIERGEDLISSNISDDGKNSRVIESDYPSVAGVISQENKECICVPRDGSPVLPDGRPTLSASQIESYLECPFKWFSLRRMGLDDSDAGFSGLEKGSFVHRVLEVTYIRLLSEALGVDEKDLPEAMAGIDLTQRISGSAVTSENIEHALELMNDEFDEHLAHQYLSGSRKSSQALIAHSQSELFQLRELREEIASALEWETDKFKGFEPRLFEQRFGGKKGFEAQYAGADFVGSIDRIDIDDQGNALIIDYKHKSFMPGGEYALFASGDDGMEFVMPRHVQSLIYAQVVRRAMPDITPIGAVYFSTKGNHAISGAVKDTFIERIWGKESKAYSRCALNPDSKLSFEDLLDMTEEKIAIAIEDMKAGNIVAKPCDNKACLWCPVSMCERRIG